MTVTVRTSGGPISVSEVSDVAAQDRLQTPRVLDLGAGGERGADVVRPGGEGDAHLQPRFDGVRDGRLVLQHAFVFLGAANRLREHAAAIDHDLELATELEPSDHPEVGLEQPDFDDVFAVERQRGLHRHAAARAERQAVVVLVLRVVGGRTEDAGAWHDVRDIADGERRDLGGGARVALEQRRRDVQHLADVVEAVGGLVRRQQRRDVNVERQRGRELRWRIRRGSAGE